MKDNAKKSIIIGLHRSLMTGVEIILYFMKDWLSVDTETWTWNESKTLRERTVERIERSDVTIEIRIFSNNKIRKVWRVSRKETGGRERLNFMTKTFFGIITTHPRADSMIWWWLEQRKKHERRRTLRQRKFHMDQRIIEWSPNTKRRDRRGRRTTQKTASSMDEILSEKRRDRRLPKDRHDSNTSLWAIWRETIF